MKNVFMALVFVLLPMISFANAQKVDIRSLTVSPLGQDQYYSYNFGTQPLYSRSYVEFTLTSTGTEPLTVRGITIAGSMYEAYSDCPDILSPGQKCYTTVYFVPRLVGSHYGELNFFFPDHKINIQLVGWGRR